MQILRQLQAQRINDNYVTINAFQASIQRVLVEYIPREPKALYELITQIRVLENIESWI